MSGAWIGKSLVFLVINKPLQYLAVAHIIASGSLILYFFLIEMAISAISSFKPIMVKLSKNSLIVSSLSSEVPANINPRI